MFLEINIFIKNFKIVFLDNRLIVAHNVFLPGASFDNCGPKSNKPVVRSLFLVVAYLVVGIR